MQPEIRLPLYFVSLRRWVVVALVALTLAGPGSAVAKPNLWVYTDLSDPRNQRSGGHPYNDPDDICALAALLLQANRFDIHAVVYASNTRLGLADPTPFVQETFAAAYEHDWPHLEQTFGGYQRHIPFKLSSINRDGKPRKFSPQEDYRDLTRLDTVRELVDLASREPVYVLNWGPLTESAMAVKHCLTTGNLTALANLTIISHWTMSFIAQGSPETPYAVANCRDDADACAYLHQVATGLPKVSFIEVGSVGQTGIVNGTANYARNEEFMASRLGQIFITSKFYHGKPDFSDGATYWLLSEGYGPGMAHYRRDGSLDQATEEAARNAFLADGHAIMDNLLLRSNAAAQARQPFPAAFLAERFTYVYRFLNGRYYIYVPLAAEYEIFAPDGQRVLHGSLSRGEKELDFEPLPKGDYPVIVRVGGIERRFTLTKPN